MSHLYSIRSSFKTVNKDILTGFFFFRFDEAYENDRIQPISQSKYDLRNLNR